MNKELSDQLRVEAAIRLRISESGIPELDKMIAKAERRDIAVSIAQGNMANCEVDMTDETLIAGSFEVADAILKERNKLCRR